MADSAAPTWLEAARASAALDPAAEDVAVGTESLFDEGFIEELEDELEDGS